MTVHQPETINGEYYAHTGGRSPEYLSGVIGSRRNAGELTHGKYRNEAPAMRPVIPGATGDQPERDDINDPPGIEVTKRPTDRRPVRHAERNHRADQTHESRRRAN